MKNIRSIQAMEAISIKPLTICVGRNSSGKSTFIRTFPLLKQSIEVKMSEPLLWYGPYVDFGSFEESLCRLSDEKEVELYFEWKQKKENLSGYRTFYRGINRFRIAEGEFIKLKLNIEEKFIKKIEVEIGDQKIAIISDQKGNIKLFEINGMDLFKNQKRVPLIFAKQGGNLLPVILENDEGESDFSYGIKCFKQEWVKALKSKAYKSTKDDTILKIMQRIYFGNKEKILSQLHMIGGPEQLKRELEKLKLQDELFLSLNNLVVGNYILEIIEYLNLLLRQDIGSVKYIKPIRAMIDRYYRIQGLSIDELDSAGANLPMLFYNLSDREKMEFRDWTYEKFGIGFFVQSHEGHVSLILEDPKTKEKYNLADVGYGYSQVIPIVMQLWLLSHRRYQFYDTYNVLLIIEQPELHLHPAFQAKLVDMFVSILYETKNLGINLSIMFETHSETMINRVGYLIAKKQIEGNQVNILLFDKVDGKTNIREKRFNKKGMLEEWPLGFFSPD